MAGTIATTELHSGADETPPVFKDLSGSREIIQGAWAWVLFEATGTVSVVGAFNVASITDNGTGDFDVNFSNAMPSVNYAAVGMTSGNRAVAEDAGALPSSTSSFTIRTFATSTATKDDPPMIAVAFFCNP